MTPTTELRIEGTVRIPEGQGNSDYFSRMFADFKEFIEKQGYNFTGSIVPKEDPTGMSLYKVEEVKKLKKEKTVLEEYIAGRNKTDAENVTNLLNLTAQLEQKANEVENWKFNYDHLHQQYTTKQLENQKQIQELETKLRLKENTPWKMFVKWFKALVGK